MKTLKKARSYGTFATRAGNKNNETTYSVPLAKSILEANLDQKPLNASERQVALELIAQHQLIGTYLTRRMSLEDIEAQVMDAAKAANLLPCSYFRLLELVFVADAASYKYLRETVFAIDVSAGRLVPKDQESYAPLRKYFCGDGAGDYRR